MYNYTSISETPPQSKMAAIKYMSKYTSEQINFLSGKCEVYILTKKSGPRTLTFNHSFLSRNYRPKDQVQFVHLG